MEEQSKLVQLAKTGFDQHFEEQIAALKAKGAWPSDGMARDLEAIEMYAWIKGFATGLGFDADALTDQDVAEFRSWMRDVKARFDEFQV